MNLSKEALSQELKEAGERRAKVVEQLNQNDQQKQVLLQELLRIDGDIRTIQKFQKLVAGQKDTESAKIEEVKEEKKDG